MTDTEARERLAELMEERRLELHLTWREVAEAAGVSYEAIRDVRASRTRPIRPLTRRGIDKGLQWAEGRGVDNILAGRPPVPAPSASDPLLAEVQAFAREMGTDPEVLAPFIRAVDEEVRRAGEGASGRQIFGGDPVGDAEAGIWDLPKTSREIRTMLIAVARAEAARYDAGQHNGRSGTAGLAPLLTLAGR